MYPENPEGTQIIVGSMNMGYISDTARNRTHNLFRPKREPIPLGHSDGQLLLLYYYCQSINLAISKAQYAHNMRIYARVVLCSENYKVARVY